MGFVIIEPKLGARACDHYGHVTAAQCQALRADGFDGIFLYAETVTAEDLTNATAAGLWVGFVLEGLASATVPSASLGRSVATNGIGHLRSLGVPSGITVFADLENAGHPPDAWIDFGNAAADAITALGDIPGGYFGVGTGLTSAEMYSLHFTRYWAGAGRLVDRNNELAAPSCGWCVVQGTPIDIVHAPSGLQIDLDIVWHDFHARGIKVLAFMP